MRLTQDEVRQLVDLVIEQQLADPASRRLLHAGIDPHISAQITTSRKPGQQVEFDLRDLAVVEPGDGHDPLLTWLDNLAREVACPRAAGAVRVFADRLRVGGDGSRVAAELGELKGVIVRALTRAVETFAELDQPRQADEVRRRIEAVSNGPSVAVVGRYSSGKSTLVNALAGRVRLPVRLRPTTAAMVLLRSSDEGRVAITSRTGEQRRIDREGIEHQIARHEHSDKPADRRQVARLRSFDPGEPPPDLDEIIRRAEAGDLDALDRCLRERRDGVAAHIESVSLDEPFRPERVPSGAIVIDTPGVDSPVVSHGLATRQALRQCDSVLLLVPPQANRHDAEFDLLDTYRTIRGGTEKLGERLVCAVSRIDQVEDDEDETYFVERFREVLADCDIVTEVFTCSSLIALQGDLHASGHDIGPEALGRLRRVTSGRVADAWPASGLSAVLDAVWLKAERHRARTILCPALERTLESICALSAELQSGLQVLREGMDEMERRISALEETATALNCQRPGFLHRCRTRIAQRLDQLTEVESLVGVFDATLDACEEPASLEDALNAAGRKWGERRCAAFDTVVAELADELTAEAADHFAKSTSEDISDGLAPRLEIQWTLSAAFIIKASTPKRPPLVPVALMMIGGGIGAFFGAAAAAVGGAVGAAVGWLVGEDMRSKWLRRKAEWFARAKVKLAKVIPKARERAEKELRDEAARLGAHLEAEVEARVDAWLDALRARIARQKTALAGLRSDREAPVSAAEQRLERVAAVQRPLRMAADQVDRWLRGAHDVR